MTIVSRTTASATMNVPSVTAEEAKQRAPTSALSDATSRRGIVSPSSPATHTAKTMSEEDAKNAWLARIDEEPSWLKATTTTSAPSTMTEEEAKKAWLAKLDVPTWGKTVAAVADLAEEAEKMSEEEAKKAWLAKLDVPAWGAAAAAALSAVATVSAEFDDASGVSAEQIAKQSWLARLDADQTQKDAANAKKKWLAKLDAPSWGKAAKALATVAQEASAMQLMSEACDQGDAAACDSLSREDEAKRAWLARLDVPNWTATAAAVSAVATQVGA